MKHDFKVTFFLMMLFFTAQIVGLFLLNQSIASVDVDINGTIQVNYSEPITGRPEMDKNTLTPLTYTFFMIILGTVLLLLLIKFKLFKVWKVWFFLAIFGALAISLSVIMPEWIALAIALVFTFLKLYKPNILIHNLTEVFMYGGITIMLAPLFTVTLAVLLLIAISIYDAIAVWKLKHMITLATAQADEKMFAGILIPYQKQEIKESKTEKKAYEEIKKKETKEDTKEATIKTKIEMKIPKGFKEENVKSAILGGGDIAFPMLFAGAVMTWLIEQGIAQNISFFYSLIVSLFAGIALFLLFIKSKKDKFYPAMPFISAGCFVGLGVVYVLLNFL